MKKIRHSEILLNKLSSSCDAMNILFVKPILDVKTRWNSTCEMLEVAIKLKLALNMLCVNNSGLKQFKLNDIYNG